MASEKLMVGLGAVLTLLVPGVCGVAIIGAGTFVNGIKMQSLEVVEIAPPIVTLAEFEQIETSMSYREVVDLIGVPGLAIEPPTAQGSTAGDDETNQYLWKNDDASIMKATFQNGELVKKSQLFLE